MQEIETGYDYMYNKKLQLLAFKCRILLQKLCKISDIFKITIARAKDPTM